MAGRTFRPIQPGQESSMKRVTGIGAIFFKSTDPKALGEWYKAHLGVDVQEWGGAAFRWAAIYEHRRDDAE